MRVGVGGFVDGRLVFVVGAALARQLVHTERVVNVVRIGADGMSVRKGRWVEQSVVMWMERMWRRVVMVVTGSGWTGPWQHVVQAER